MSKIIHLPPSPGAEGRLSDEERARRLRAEVERLARLPTVEWRFYLDSTAEQYGISKTDLKAMIEAVIRKREKRAREDKADKRYEQRRTEQKQQREDTRTRQDEARARKEAERIERAEEAKRKKRETAFAEIADLPKLTHQVRLREGAARLGEDYEGLVQEFEIYLAARTIPEELKPWGEAVDAAELLASIEAKFCRYVVASDAIVVAAVLWTAFTYLIDIATHAPKLLFTFPEKDAGKSTALHVVRWMVQRAYAAAEATGAVLYRIIDRLKPTVLLDEADTLFQRRTALAHIINESWTNSGSKIPRARAGGKGFDEYDVYGAQLIGMRGLRMPDTTQSRCIVCLIWPKLASEEVEEFNYRDDDDFKVIRRKLMRWAIDNAVTLRAAKPAFPPGFNNRVRTNWKLLLGIADLAGDKWSGRARKAALELETDRDEPSEMARLFAALRDVWGKAEKRTSKSLCAALVAHASGEWASFRGKGPISQHQLAALLRPFGIRPAHNLHLAGRATDNQGGYLRSQFENAWARLLQKPSQDSLTRSPAGKRKR
jgi:putative DNA primase/helicase